MYILIDENKYITVASWGGRLKDGIEIEGHEDFEFTEDMRAYQYIDGQIILDKDKLQQLQNEQAIQEELQLLQEQLEETDRLVLQRFEESQLGITPNEQSAGFESILRERQTARTKIKELQQVYREWQAGVAYVTADRVRYEGVIFEVLQAHTSADHWRPPVAHSLYRRFEN